MLALASTGENCCFDSAVDSRDSRSIR